jgi:hypothetical protein
MARFYPVVLAGSSRLHESQSPMSLKPRQSSPWIEDIFSEFRAEGRVPESITFSAIHSADFGSIAELRRDGEPTLAEAGEVSRDPHASNILFQEYLTIFEEAGQYS